jgi:hypothetical protein
MAMCWREMMVVTTPTATATATATATMVVVTMDIYIRDRAESLAQLRCSP